MENGVELVVFTLWDSIEAMRKFGGPEPNKAVVEPEARAVLTSFDEYVTHFDVVDGVVLSSKTAANPEPPRGRDPKVVKRLKWWFDVVCTIMALAGVVIAFFGLDILPVERSVLLKCGSAIYGSLMMGWGTTLLLAGKWRSEEAIVS